MKQNRQYLICKLITEQDIFTQEELVLALHKEGLEVTQGTISRDIRELHLIKVAFPDKRRSKYALSQRQSFKPENKLNRALVDHYLHGEVANNLVVIRCLPGTASTLSALIDEMNWTFLLLGTISGDDTILLITKGEQQAKEVLEKINALRYC